MPRKSPLPEVGLEASALEQTDQAASDVVVGPTDGARELQYGSDPGGPAASHAPPVESHLRARCDRIRGPEVPRARQSP